MKRICVGTVFKAATIAMSLGLFGVTPVVAQDGSAIPRLRPLDLAPFQEAMAALDPGLIEGMDRALRGLTVPQLQAAMIKGELTSETLTLYFLHRIAAHDEQLRTFLELNPEALDEARAADRAFAEGTVLGPMQGIPVTLKDNIETAAPMHTTAGAELLLDNVAADDAELVKQLRAGGAVILGKANLSEFAGAITIGAKIGGATAIAGQGINPFGNYPTGGSSSGSAGGVAAMLTMVSVGSETSGSLIAPSAWQGVVGMKPSRGLVSGEGVIPLVLNNDSAGPIARTVTDLAALLEVIDSGDVVYSDALRFDALNGVTAGVLAADLAGEAGNADLLARIATTLTLTGADVVPTSLVDESDALAAFDTFLAAGIRYDMMPYVAKLRPEVDTPRALYDYNAADAARRVPFGQASFGHFVDTAEAISENDFHEMETALTVAATAIMDAAFAASGAEVLVSIDNAHSQQYATAGYPAITVPLGARSAGGIFALFGGDSSGMPVGVTLIGKQGEDAALLGFAYAFEQASQFRISPETGK
jgi:amidase